MINRRGGGGGTGIGSSTSSVTGPALVVVDPIESSSSSSTTTNAPNGIPIASHSNSSINNITGGTSRTISSSLLSKKISSSLPVLVVSNDTKYDHDDHKQTKSHSSSIGGRWNTKSILLIIYRNKMFITIRTTINKYISPQLQLLFIIAFGIIKVIVFLYMILRLVFYSTSSQRYDASTVIVGNEQQQQLSRRNNANSDNNNNNNVFCTFRKYPLHRYYKLQYSETRTLDFLSSDTEYINGQWPILLSLSNKQQQQLQPSTKLCVNQTSWLPSTILSQQQQQQQQQSPATSNNNNNNNIIWPFADGTNPSIVSIQRLQKEAPGIAQQFVQYYPNAAYIITICMTLSQCTWDDTEQYRTDGYSLPNLQQQQPDTVRTVIQLLNINYEPLVETTVYLIKNAPYGTLHNKKRKNPKKFAADPTLQPTIIAFDDARLFIYNQQLYVSYREGPSFGYDAQVLNPIHFVIDSSNIAKSFQAYVFASETTNFCCGRNMALLSVLPPQSSSSSSASSSTTKSTNNNNNNTPILRSVTWVDPVTVITVDTQPPIIEESDIVQQPVAILRNIQQKSNTNNNDSIQQQVQRRRRLVQTIQQSKQLITLSVSNPSDTIHAIPSFITSKVSDRFDSTNVTITPQRQQRGRHRHRRLATTTGGEHKSHIHGTNGFMVYLPKTNEYIGIAHFHRPNDRNRNPYARFGHHYTHAFYTIRQNDDDDHRVENSSSSSSHNNNNFVLTGLSNEFIIPSQYDSNDGHIIQFISGMEYNTQTDEIILAYGINDCEGAITTLDLQTIRTMIQPVLDGKQVIDYMKPLVQSSKWEKYKKN